MKPLLVVSLLICGSLVVKGQDGVGYAAVDYKALQIPDAETKSSQSIAGYMQSNFKNNKEVIRAIYTWVTRNIQYDKDSMYPINWSMYREEKIAATLRRRKGVCENYAALFTDILLKCNIQSFVVSGNTRQSGSVNSAGHSWCAVNLQQQWYLCDPTWDKDSRGNTKYFLIEPAQFIESHMPFDPLWQLLEYPLTTGEFKRGVFYSKKDKPPYHFADSANAFLQLDSLRQLEASTARIRAAGIENERVNNWLAYNQMKIAIIKGEDNMALYNAAVADLNKANTVFNNYVQFRNNQFMPAKTDAAMKSMLDPVDVLLSSANEKLRRLDIAENNFQYDTGDLKSRIAMLAKKVSEQQIFIAHYLSGSVAERGKLFYQ